MRVDGAMLPRLVSQWLSSIWSHNTSSLHWWCHLPPLSPLPPGQFGHMSECSSLTSEWSTGVPQGWAHSLLFTVLIHNFSAKSGSNYNQVCQCLSFDCSSLLKEGSTVASISSTKIRGASITDDHTWSLNNTINKKTQQCLHFLWRLKSARLPTILTIYTFYALYSGDYPDQHSMPCSVFWGQLRKLPDRTFSETVHAEPLPSSTLQ